MNPLFSPIAAEPFVGPRRAEVLARLPVRTPAEMLFYFPRDYEDFSNFTDIHHLKEDELQTICARIVSVRNRSTHRGVMTTVEIEDGTYGLAEILFFNQRFRAEQLLPEQIYLISGKPKSAKRRWQFVHPILRLLPPEEIALINANTVPGNRLGTGTGPDSAGVSPQTLSVPEDIPTAASFLGLQPVYRLTEGVHQWELRRLSRSILSRCADFVEDALPQPFREKYELLSIGDALRGMHFPKSQTVQESARRRFVFQELFLLQLALEVRRKQQQVEFKAPILEATPAIDRRIRQLFPYDLTQGQLRAIADVTRDTTSGRPMNRLLQGDVGCGKTTVAVYAVLLAVAHGFQAAIMAPTEVLARQHVRTLRKLLAHSPVELVELVGGLKPQERRETLEKISSGTANIIVGTHALLQSDVAFSKLGMVIIDEQHKFGVNQRAALRKSGESPHYLVMTATPIPRTVTMTLFGDLDITTIRELPPGRQKIKTYLATKENRAGWWTFFCDKLRSGAQGYVVVPRIGDVSVQKSVPGENSENTLKDSPLFGGSGVLSDAPSTASSGRGPNSAATSGSGPVFGNPRAEQDPDFDAEGEKESDVANLQKLYRELSTGPLAEFPIGSLHGRMTSEEKELAMYKFRTGETRVLISTLVIEVGVDIPNATLMTIDSAERFGLAQLHQLRGRIARGTKPGYCCVFASNEREETLERLRIFTGTTDGFELSEVDFKLRGPGNLFGTQQHGLPPLLVADLLRDESVLEETRVAARETLTADPGLSDPSFRLIRQQMLRRYGAVLELGDVG